jgi:transposase
MQATVVVSGRNSRRVILGAITVMTGELARVVRERSRTDDVVAFIETLAQIRPEVNKLLTWDNAPPHHPHRVRDTAAEAQISLAFLPFRSPEPEPLRRPVAASEGGGRGSSRLCLLGDPR